LNHRGIFACSSFVFGEFTPRKQRKKKNTKRSQRDKTEKEGFTQGVFISDFFLRPTSMVHAKKEERTQLSFFTP